MRPHRIWSTAMLNLNLKGCKRQQRAADSAFHRSNTLHLQGFLFGVRQVGAGRQKLGAEPLNRNTNNAHIVNVGSFWGLGLLSFVNIKRYLRRTVLTLRLISIMLVRNRGCFRTHKA